MADLNNIDKLFRESAESFSATAPEKSWGKLSSSIIRKKRLRRIYNLYIPAIAVLFASAAILYFNFDNEIGAFEYADIEQETNQKLNQESETKLNIENEIAENDKNLNIENKEDKTESTQNNNQQIQNPENIISKSESETDESRILDSEVNKLANKSDNIDESKTNKTESKEYLSEKEFISEDDFELEFVESKLMEIELLDTFKAPRVYDMKYLKTFNDGFFKYLSFSLFYGPDVSYRKLQGKNPEPIYTAYTENERPNIGVSGGFLMNYEVFNRFEISLGAINSKIGFTGEFRMPTSKQSYLKLSRFGYTSGGYYEVDKIGQVMSANSIESVDQIRYFENIKTSYNIFSIPIRLSYSFNFNKFQFKPFAGFSAAYVYKNIVELGSTNSWDAAGHIEETTDYLYGTSFGMGFNYQISNNFRVGIEPSLTYYFTSLSTSPDFNLRPYLFRLAPGLIYSF